MAQKSKTKIYYWLKFDKHFFDNLFIKRLLRNFPGGSEMIVISREEYESLVNFKKAILEVSNK
ncbi:hypothetical protein SAG0176_10650 [Streptococcus agalactiae LDS 623]|nr:hypothetical protein SAG0176_10650 [Streptococcus agalactiae LDS 623]